jgi:hypothetical protein
MKAYPTTFEVPITLVCMNVQQPFGAPLADYVGARALIASAMGWEAMALQKPIACKGGNQKVEDVRSTEFRSGELGDGGDET